ncbi:MAG: hypothetical protein ACKO24_07285 [Leptolyngbyaceae cyanobacterium]
MKSTLLRLSFLLFTLSSLVGFVKPARATDAIAVSFALPSPASTVQVDRPVAAPPTTAVDDSAATTATPLSFNPSPPTPLPLKPALPDQAKLGVAEKQYELFTGGADSLVARTVGHAEGTRGVDGSKTAAYYGHTDPGNGVWNIGSFSFQHCGAAAYTCTSPEEADRHQLRRLEGQAAAMRQRATMAGVQLSLEAELNGIDLANQAPAAALGQPGYVEWLDRAGEKGMQGQEAVLWARVSAYWDPQIKGWNAPGLGNSESSITHDQRRRMMAIARVLEANPTQVAQVATLPPASPPR